jgi:hypothetical protein
MLNKKKLLTATFGISLISLCAYGAEIKAEIKKEKEDTDVLVTFGLGGVKADSELNKASVMGVGIAAHAKHNLTTDLQARISAGMNVQTGSSSSARENNIYTPSNGNYLKEALLSYSPIELIELEGGVVNQSFLKAPMVVDKKGFIAAKEKFTYKVLDTRFSIIATQAIPNNRNLSQKINVNDEGDPRFFAETLRIEQELFVGDAELNLTHYAYDNISNSVAYESILLGNTGTPIDKGNGVLANTYSGWNADLTYNFNISNNLNLAFNGNYILNTAAKENNEGHRAGTTLTYTSGDSKYTFILENFSIDADASVAYYNSSRYGMANKNGNRIRAEYHNLPNGLNMGVEAISNKVINENIYQSDETVILFSLRKTYDLF